MSIYANTIREFAPATHDPRHIECFMRLEHSTLDHLSRAQFRREVQIAMACVDEIGPAESERLAKSYGL